MPCEPNWHLGIACHDYMRKKGRAFEIVGGEL